MAVALGLSATGNQVDPAYTQALFIVQDTLDDKKTDADSLPIPAPGKAPGKLDSTPFRDETPRPVNTAPSPRPADPPVSQPVKPEASGREVD